MTGPAGAGSTRIGRRQRPANPQRGKRFPMIKDFSVLYAGLEQIMIAFPMGAATAQFKEQLGGFAAKVIPHFRKAAGGAAEA